MIRPHRVDALFTLAGVILLFRLNQVTGSAHGGHAHDDGGVRLDGIVDVVATVAVLAIVYVLATWFLRYRDIRANGGESATGCDPVTDREGSG